MRRVALGIWGFTWGSVATVFLVRGDPLNTWVALFFLVMGALAALYWLGTTNFIGPRLPDLAFERNVTGRRSIHFDPPERPTKRKLRKKSLALAEEMREYIRDTEPTGRERQAEWRQRIDHVQSQQGKSPEEVEGQRIEYHGALEDKGNRETRDIHERFGGSVDKVLRQYARRSVIDHEEVRGIETDLSSRMMLEFLADRLESLAREL